MERAANRDQHLPARLVSSRGHAGNSIVTAVGAIEGVVLVRGVGVVVVVGIVMIGIGVRRELGRGSRSAMRSAAVALPLGACRAGDAHELG